MGEGLGEGDGDPNEAVASLRAGLELTRSTGARLDEGYFLGLLAERYYQLVHQIIRKYDTRALILGDRYQSFSQGISIGAREIALMKPGATLTNVARGGVVENVVVSGLVIDCVRHDWFWWGDALEFYRGPGVQHIAITTPDIIHSIDALREAREDALREVPAGTAAMLARWIGAPMERITYTCAGINHQTWYISVKHRGGELRGKLLEAFARHLGVAVQVLEGVGHEQNLADPAKTYAKALRAASTGIVFLARAAAAGSAAEKNRVMVGSLDGKRLIIRANPEVAGRLLRERLGS